MSDTILYNVMGYPDIGRFNKICSEIDRLGIEILEIGIPSENPFLEGETIANAHNVVENEYDSEDLLSLLKWIRENTQLKIVLMTYFDGFENFKVKDIEQDLYDAVLCVDNNLDEYPHIPKIQLYDEQDNLEDVQRKLENNVLFCYIKSSGQTGTKATSLEPLKPVINLIKEETHLPVHIGFGIKNKEDIEEAKKTGADGVIIGTEFIRQINHDIDNLSKVSNYLIRLI